MPTVPYIRVLTSVNGDAPTAGARTVENGDTIALSFESTTSWPHAPARLEMYSYPEGWAGPGAPWTTESVGIQQPDGTSLEYTAFVYLGNQPPPAFTAPADPLRGKFLGRARLADGKKGGIQSTDMNDESWGFEILLASGLHDIAWQEGSQFASEPWRKWQGDLAANIRLLDGLLVGIGTPVASVSGAAPIVSTGGTNPVISINPASGGAAGSMSAAHYTLVQNATSNPTASTIVKWTSDVELRADFFSATTSTSNVGELRLTREGVLIAAVGSLAEPHALITEDGLEGFIYGDDGAVSGHALTAGHRYRFKAGGRCVFEGDGVDIVTVNEQGVDLLPGTGLTSSGANLIDDGAGAAIVRVGSDTGGEVEVRAGAGLFFTIIIGGSTAFSVEEGQTRTVGEVYSETSRTTAYTTLSTSTALTLGDRHVRGDATGGSIVLTLPAAAAYPKGEYFIKKVDATGNTVTIDGAGSEPIDGATTYVIGTQYRGIHIKSNGTNAWEIWGTF